MGPAVSISRAHHLLHNAHLYRYGSGMKKADATSSKGEPGEIADAPFKSMSRNEKAENIILYLLFDIVLVQLYIVFSLHAIKIGKHCMLKLRGNLYIHIYIYISVNI